MKCKCLCRSTVAALAIACIAGTFHGSTLAAQGLEEPPPMTLAYCAVEVRTPVAPTVPRQPDRTFSAAEILDLEFKVILRLALEGEHLLRLDLFTPSRHLYQQLTVPFTGDPGQMGVQRRVEGFPRPLEMQVLKRGDGPQGQAPYLEVRFPVAGTSIVQNSLYGEWSAIAHVDGQPRLRCSSPPFYIVE